MSTEIHYLPQDLGKRTTSCIVPSTTKGGVLHKKHSQTRPKTTGASHTLLVADPYHAVLSQTANLPASRERQTNILVMAHCRGHTKPVLFQDKTTETMKHGSGFTNLQSLMSQFCITPGLVLHGELPEATIPLPTPGMPSRPLSCALSRSWRVTQLSSLMEIIPAAQVHKISLSIETHTYLGWAELPCGHAMTVHCVKKGRKRNPWAMVGSRWTGTHSHSYPRLKWSYIQVGFQDKGCYVIFHCTSFSAVCCASTKYPQTLAYWFYSLL